MAKPRSTYPQNPVSSGQRPRGRRVGWPFALIAIVGSIGFGGCRHIDNAQVDVLESQLRKQEDYIYELEGYLMEYSEKLRQARAMQCDPASAATRKSSADEPTLDVDSVKRPTLPMNGRDKLGPPPKPSLPAPPATTEAPPAELEKPVEPEEIDPEQMEAPALEIGPGVQVLPQRTFETAALPPLLIPDPIDYQADGDGAPVEGPHVDRSAGDHSQSLAESVGDDRLIARNEPAPGSAGASLASEPPATPAGDESSMAESSLAAEPLLAAPQVAEGPIEERLTADHLQIRRVFAERPADEATGIDSLLIVLEALNATDEPVGAEGEASLMIMARDDSPSGIRRIERWDFTADETAAAWQSSQLGDGLHLELPVTASSLPTGGDLELWARIVTPDGRKLLTQIPLEPATLASMADFQAEQSLVAEIPGDSAPLPADLQPIPSAAPRSAQVVATPITKTAAEEAKPTWRPSSVRLNEDRTDPDGATAELREAASVAAKPAWKRSTAAAAGETKRDWAPFR